jgi:hypothetical protein
MAAKAMRFSLISKIKLILTGCLPAALGALFEGLPSLPRPIVWPLFPRSSMISCPLCITVPLISEYWPFLERRAIFPLVRHLELFYRWKIMSRRGG